MSSDKQSILQGVERWSKHEFWELLIKSNDIQDIQENPPLTFWKEFFLHPGFKAWEAQILPLTGLEWDFLRKAGLD